MKYSGGCQCGHVRYAVDGELHFAAVCHCPSCRKSSGAPVVSWAMFERSDVTWDETRPKKFQSSEGVQRSFCPHCGTTLFFEADYIEGLVDITVESADDPDQLLPRAQIWTQHETACLKTIGQMERYDALPPQ